MGNADFLDRLGAIVEHWAARGALSRLPVTRDRLVSRLEALGAPDTLADAPDFELVIGPGMVRCMINGFTVAREWPCRAAWPQPARPGRRGAPPEALAEGRLCAAWTVARKVAAHDARCLPTIRALREKGYGWRRIGRVLAREGVEPPGRRAGYAQGRWRAMTVLRIARRHGIA